MPKVPLQINIGKRKELISTKNHPENKK